MDFENDYMDQNISAGKLPTADSGPNAQFLTNIPDWMNITTNDLNMVFKGLPIPLQGPAPPGISLQEAIKVNLRHDTH
jgi:hypothetical protein